MTAYPKRLIEVDLPIKRISAHARREKSIRHGHISTLHIWWARRPLAACRAVICAALWPDPADPICPQSFRDAASQLITDFAEKVFRDRFSATTRFLPSRSVNGKGSSRPRNKDLHSIHTTRLISTSFASPFSTSSPISPTGTTRPSLPIQGVSGGQT